MDMLVGFIQIACIAGLVYGLYLSITYAGSDEFANSYHRLKPRQFADDPLGADAFALTRQPPADRLLEL